MASRALEEGSGDGHERTAAIAVPRRLNLVALSPNDWDGQWVNRQQLLSRLAGQHRVVYSNGALAVWERGSKAWKRAHWLGRFDSRDGVELDRPARLAPRWPAQPWWDESALRLHAARLRRRCEASLPIVAYLCHPSFLAYADLLRPDYVVYHCYDLFENQPGWNAELDAAERALLRRADLVFAPTAMLAEHLQAKAPCAARALPNAADVRAIEAARVQGVAMPDDLAAIPAPRIGYVGSIHPQLDYALLAALAARHRDWHFVLIGPEQKTDLLHAGPAFQACAGSSNVHLLGSRHRSLVPAYLLHMDANVMFYSTAADSWTRVAYPLKLHEYLACGRPVVSVPLPMINEFAALIRFVDGVDAWDAALCAALAEDDDALRRQRRAAAAQHSWEARTEVLAGWLAELPALRAARTG